MTERIQSGDVAQPEQVKRAFEAGYWAYCGPASLKELEQVMADCEQAWVEYAAQPPAAPVEPYVYAGDGRSAPVETPPDWKQDQADTSVLPRKPIPRSSAATGSAWPHLKMALWRVLMDEQLNDGHYIKAFDLIEKLHGAATAAVDVELADLRCLVATYAKEANEAKAALTVNEPQAAPTREAIARIIDPDAWLLYDNANALTQMQKPVSIWRIEPSFAQADAILALSRPERQGGEHG